MLSSSESSASWCACITATAVSVLLTEAIMTGVSIVTGTLVSRLAMPKPAVLHESWDSETQPTPELPILSSITPCIEFEDSWDTESTEFERQVLELTNQRRAEGADCHTEGVFEPAVPLTLNTKLRCAAKSHSFDMADRNYVAHISPGGTSPATRAQNAGYSYQIVGENIAAGQTTPEQAVAGWMHSDGHCANLMNPSYEEMGAGYAPSDQPPYYHYWTQVFGRPRNF